MSLCSAAERDAKVLLVYCVSNIELSSVRRVFSVVRCVARRRIYCGSAVRTRDWRHNYTCSVVKPHYCDAIVQPGKGHIPGICATDSAVDQEIPHPPVHHAQAAPDHPQLSPSSSSCS